MNCICKLHLDPYHEEGGGGFRIAFIRAIEIVEASSASSPEWRHVPPFGSHTTIVVAYGL